MKRNILLTVGILIVICLAVGIIITKPWSNSNTDGTAKNSSTTNASQTITNITTDLKQKYGSVSFVDAASTASIPYAVAGYDYKVLLTDGQAAFTAKQADVAAGQPVQALPTDLEDSVQSLLEKEGYASTDPGFKTTLYTGSSLEAHYYKNKAAVCYYPMGVGNNVTGKNSFTLSCADTNSFTAAAQNAKPFADAYTKAQSIAADKLFVGAAKVEANGQNPSYSHAIVPIAVANSANPSLPAIQSGSYFYKTADQDAWLYFGSSQEGLSCNSSAFSQNSEAATALSDVCR